MKLSKFLSLTAFITLFSLLYVYQQSEIVRLAYAGQRQQTTFQELLDKNSILRYNIEKNSSLVHLTSSISGQADLQMPDTYQLVRLVPSREGLMIQDTIVSKETLFSRIFGVKKQAEARTINP
ncbi:MAG: hypothetical protein NTW13_06900 [Candidatus Omnitrophica bacterium]|nr:hypothetical protein [Candidatus Omnitrophota bacterium]